MKKALSVALTIVLMASLVGCGSNSSTTEASSQQQQASSSEATPQKSEEPVMSERLSERATTNTIPAAMKEKAKSMPNANYQNLPKWHGTTLVNKSEYGWGVDGNQDDYSEGLVNELSEIGFDFIRVTQDTRIFFSEEQGEPGEYFDGDSNYVNTKELKNLDNLISWCIDKGIHVCFDVHSTPGGYMIGGDEEASRELLFTAGSKEEQIFIDFWEFMALRYADVPNNALSFNLYNEPPRFATDEQYTALMKKAIAAVTKATPDRLIFVDMLEYGTTPVYGLVGEKVVQTFHSYQPYEFTHTLVDNSDYEAGEAARKAEKREVVTYPLPAIKLSIGDSGYVVNGDFNAGTILTMRFGEGAAGAEVYLLADGNEVFRQTTSPDMIEKSGMKINDEGNFEYWADINPDAKKIEVTCTLPADAKELKFKLKDPDKWLDINELIIETDKYKTKLSGRWIEEIGDALPPTRAKVDENGIVSLQNDAEKYSYGKDDIEALLKKYDDFSKETGTKIMLQEFGDCVYTEINGAKAFYDDVLSVCDELNIGWCHYAYDGGDFSIVAISPQYERRGATYVELSTGRRICKELWDVLKRHMK